MKKTIMLIALILALVLAAGLCACGEENGTNAGKTQTPGNQTDAGNAQYETDKATLETAGYTVTSYAGAETLAPIEEANGLSVGSLEAWLMANKNDYSTLLAYYFKTADAASAFHASRDGSALKGKAVILNDTDELISK